MKEVKENVKYIVIKILYIIIIPIILYDFILIAQSIINPYKTASFFGIKTFNIISESMEPEININDIVVVKEVDESDLKVGDIVSFRLHSEIITHRIVKIENFGDQKHIFITKGDNNEVSDIETVDFEQIEGKQVGLIPKVGFLSIILKNKIVFAVTLSILIICFMLDRKKIANKIKRKEKRIKWDEKQEQ